MSVKRNSYGSISRGSSVRRRKKRRDDTIRLILGVLLVCVLVLAIGFLGVNALRKNKSGNQDKESDSSVQNGQESDSQGDNQNEPGQVADNTNPSTDAPTDPPTEEYVPETVTQTHVVWLDAGHGGSDLGSSEWMRDDHGNVIDKDGNIVDDSDKDDLSARGIPVVREKDDTLALTLEIQKALEERGVTVIMTRTDDTFVHRFDRAALANESDAECFVSIHRNYMIGDTKICGIEAWLVNEQTMNEVPGKEKDVDLTQFIFDQLADEETNGILGYFREASPEVDNSVNLRTTIPSLILEMGYMSNASDNELYHSQMEAYANAIADGIVEWLRTQE